MYLSLSCWSPGQKEYFAPLPFPLFRIKWFNLTARICEFKSRFRFHLFNLRIQPVKEIFNTLYISNTFHNVRHIVIFFYFISVSSASQRRIVQFYVQRLQPGMSEQDKLVNQEYLYTQFSSPVNFFHSPLKPLKIFRISLGLILLRLTFTSSCILSFPRPTLFRFQLLI